MGFLFMEIWKDIIGYEGYYKINQYGDVYSIYSSKKLNKLIHNKGYYRYTLSKNKIKKSFLVHRLIAIHFIENKLNMNEINHKDGNGYNNDLNNLEWCTHKHNINHSFSILKKSGPNKKLTNSQVKYIKEKLKNDTSVNYKEIADELNISCSIIYRIKANIVYKNII
jgi:hypothetical protein